MPEPSGASRLGWSGAKLLPTLCIGIPDVVVVPKSKYSVRETVAH